MAIELGRFKEKAAAAQVEKAAQAREKVERKQTEKEAKEQERERVTKELETASDELAGIETSLTEAENFAKESLADLSPEDRAELQSQIDVEKNQTEILKQKISELTARKVALDAGLGEDTPEDEHRIGWDKMTLGEMTSTFKELRADGSQATVEMAKIIENLDNEFSPETLGKAQKLLEKMGDVRSESIALTLELTGRVGKGEKVNPAAIEGIYNNFINFSDSIKNTRQEFAIKFLKLSNTEQNKTRDNVSSLLKIKRLDARDLENLYKLAEVNAQETIQQKNLKEQYATNEVGLQFGDSLRRLSTNEFDKSGAGFAENKWAVMKDARSRIEAKYLGGNFTDNIERVADGGGKYETRGTVLVEG